MDRLDFTTDLTAFWPGAALWDKPIAFVDLRNTDQPDELVLPLCPVIGIGDVADPMAKVVDMVVEPPFESDAILRQVIAVPHAAATIVQLLRMLPSLSPERGLTAESFAYAMLQGSAEHLAWRASNHAHPREPGTVRLIREGAILTITMDRPFAGNAIDRPMRDGLYEAFALAALDPSIEAVKLRAEGKAFSLGADLSEFGTSADPATAHTIRTMTLPARMALRCADKLSVHVQGACVGAGLEIAAFAARITARPNAWFQLPELAMGVLPGAGGCVSLTRRIGRQRAGLLMLSGKRLSARRALDWGLIDAIVDDLA